MASKAFGTAWLVEFAALLFRSVDPLHHGRDGKAVGLMWFHFIGALAGRRAGALGRFLRHDAMIFAPFRRVIFAGARTSITDLPQARSPWSFREAPLGSLILLMK
jgi:hypothetical protein